jgi:folate-binding Fe-S cluster repair protein YgfZ
MAEASAYLLERDTLVVRGADARSWLDGLVTCAVTQVQAGTAGYGLLLTKQGKIVTDVWLAFSSEGALYVGVAKGHGSSVQALLDRYLVMEDAELSAPPVPLAWRLAAENTPGITGEGEVAGGTAVLGERRLQVLVTTADSSALPSASARTASISASKTTRTRHRSIAWRCRGRRAATSDKRWCACRTCGAK